MGAKHFVTRLASRVSDFYSAHVFWRKIDRALALHTRGEARHDGLQLTSARTTLHIEWLARDVHPWDRNLSPDYTEQVFAQQCLADTSAAILRIFAEVPVLDTIELRVRRDRSQAPLMAGVVRRIDLSQSTSASAAMRLRSLGVKFRMQNMRLEPTDVPD